MDWQEASRLNNLGVAYLEHGYLDDALEQFKSSVVETMRNIQTTGRCKAFLADANSDQRDTGGDSAIALPRANRSDWNRNDCQSSFRCNLAALAPFVHIHGIQVVCSPEIYSPDPVVGACIMSSAILFNLAVAYHLQALTDRNRTVRLMKARSMYLRSQRLLTDAGVPFASTGNAMIDVVTMASFNNLAHVSYEMHFYNDAKEFFSLLIRYATTVRRSNYGDVATGAMVDQQKSAYLLNAIILHPPKLAAAA